MRELLKDIVNENSLKYICDNYKSLNQLLNSSEAELMTIPHIGKKKAKELKSILYLSKSLLMPSNSENYYILSPADVYSYLKVMSTYEEERFVGLYLNTKNKIIDSITISKGILNSSLVHPREFYAPAIRVKAAGIVAVHNHPSGNPTESKEDVEITKKLYETGKIIGIELLDHIIIGANGYTSLKEKGVI